MTKWFTADPHLGHGRVLIGPRGDHFPTIEEWNKHILGQYKSCLGKGDELFVIGDLSIERPEQWVKYLPKGTWLIRGNHDGSVGRCERAFGKRFRHVWDTTLADGNRCWLSHYAHAFWPKSHHTAERPGAYHLYGHTHDMREETLDQIWPERRSTDVSPETVFRLLGEFRPISEHEVIAHLSPRAGHDPVTFYQEKRGEYERT